jgi:hypothetical protein
MPHVAANGAKQMIQAFIALLSVATTPADIYCTPAEVAAYEARGWDAYECDGDKAASEFDHVSDWERDE